MRETSARGQRLKLLTLLAVVTWLSACSSDDELTDIHEFMRTIQQQPALQLAVPMAVQTYQSFAYGAANLRSPFEPSANAPATATTQGRNTAASPPRHHVKQYLETFPLVDLALVGTLRNERLVVALVEDKSGSVHQVRVGDYLGSQWGQVMSIKDTSLVIREIVADGQGGWLEKQNQLELNQPAPETPSE